MNNPVKPSDFKKRVVHDIAETICRPCTDPRRLKYDLNYENPVECGCRCKTVDRLLLRLSSREG